MKDLIGRTVSVDGNPCKVVAVKCGPMLLDDSGVMHTTVRVRMKSANGRMFWTPPFAYAPPEGGQE